MLKPGITTVHGLSRPHTWLGRSRHASLLLFAELAARGHCEAEAYDRLVERVRLPNGTWKQTADGRLDDLDEMITAALAESHAPGTPVSVLDLGVSTGVTSVALYDRLRRVYPVRFIASDLYRDALAVSGRGWTVLLTDTGEALQYVVGFLVLPAQLEESPVWVVNRAVKVAARRWLLPRARRVVAAGAPPALFETVRRDACAVTRIPLFSYACLDRLRQGNGFHFAVVDVRRPIPFTATVVRAVNVVTRDYLDERAAANALAHCLQAVEPGGLLLVGRSTGLAAGQTRATCYRVGADGGLTPVARRNGGCELERLTLAVADHRAAARRGEGR